MSSSNPLYSRVSAWALDEFAVSDLGIELPTGKPGSLGAMPQYGAAERTISEAELSLRIDAERARAEADGYAKGRADGERAARASMEESTTHVLSALEQAVESIQTHEARWINNAEVNIAALAVLVARQIVQRELLSDESIIADLVSKAISHYQIDEEITIRLHPEDLNVCRAIMSQSPDSSDTNNTGSPLRRLRWLSDSTIDRGGCLTEGRERIIDGRVDACLERAYRTLAEVMA